MFVVRRFLRRSSNHTFGLVISEPLNENRGDLWKLYFYKSVCRRRIEGWKASDIREDTEAGLDERARTLSTRPLISFYESHFLCRVAGMLPVSTFAPRHNISVYLPPQPASTSQLTFVTFSRLPSYSFISLPAHLSGTSSP
jgi:hypothetical protein